MIYIEREAIGMLVSSRNTLHRRELEQMNHVAEPSQRTSTRTVVGQFCSASDFAVTHDVFFLASSIQCRALGERSVGWTELMPDTHLIMGISYGPPHPHPLCSQFIYNTDTLTGHVRFAVDYGFTYI